MGDTGFKIVDQDSSAHDRITEINQLARLAPKLTLGQKIGALFEGSPKNDGPPDPSFHFTEQLIDELRENVPDRHVSKLIKARSLDEAILIRSDLMTLEGQFRADFYRDLPANIAYLMIGLLLLGILVNITKRAVKAVQYPLKVAKGAAKIVKEKVDALALKADD